MVNTSTFKNRLFYKMIWIIVLLLPEMVLAQAKVIKGVVTDAKTEQPLAFASVGFAGTMIGVASNADGEFIISVPEHMNDAVLVCSFMGYKNFETKVSMLPTEVIIRMYVDTFTLDEIEIRPWTAWDYVRNAIQKMPKNYSSDAYMTTEYYSEYISENDIYIKFTEAVLETYNPPYWSDSLSQSKLLQARRGDGLGKLTFMRKKMEKKFEKEKRKSEKIGEEREEKESIDEAIVSATFGGPEVILSADPLRDTASYLSEEHHKKYRYKVEGYSKYYGEQVIIIGFETKGKFDHQRQNGNIYISLESDVIMAVEYTSKIVIPAALKPVLFVLGYGISNPELHVTVHYKPIRRYWYLNDISLSGSVGLTKKKMFKKNDRSHFQLQMILINTLFALTNVYTIPEEERIDPEKPLEDQVSSDPEFWRTYQVIRPVNLR